MKRIVLFTCIGTLALALTAWGAPRDRQAARSAKGKSASSAHVVAARGGGHVASRATPMRTSRSFSAARSHQRVTATRSRPTSSSFARASTSRSSRMEGARTRSVRTAERAARTRTVTGSRTALNRERNVARANIARSNRAEAARIRSERNLARANSLRTNRAEATRTRNARVAQATRGAARQNLAVNRQRNLTLARNVLRNRTGDVRITNYWRSDRFRGPRYAAFYNYNRAWHDRDWWHGHCSRVVFVLGGWWGWNGGYWYPAWGYDPYAWYPYDGPIYTGYADLTPYQIIVNVQVALRDQGYYAGAVDGVLGPQTRAALAAFQSDNGLAVTSAVDQPTLQTLGVA
jgi:hypothetical protein